MVRALPKSHSRLVSRLVDLLEPFKLALLLQVDFEFGEVEVVGIAEARQEEPVHDLAEHLVA